MNSYWTFIENAYLCELPEDIIDEMIELSKGMDAEAKEKHFAEADRHWYDQPDEGDIDDWRLFNLRRKSMHNPSNKEFQDFMMRYR